MDDRRIFRARAEMAAPRDKYTPRAIHADDASNHGIKFGDPTGVRGLTIKEPANLFFESRILLDLHGGLRLRVGKTSSMVLKLALCVSQQSLKPANLSNLLSKLTRMIGMHACKRLVPLINIMLQIFPGNGRRWRKRWRRRCRRRRTRPRHS